MMGFLASRAEGSEVVLVLDREVDEQEEDKQAGTPQASNWAQVKMLQDALAERDQQLYECRLRYEAAQAELELLRQCVAVEGSGPMQLELGQLFEARLEQA